MTRIAVVDYGMGNRRSVQKALEHIGAEAVVTSDPELLGAAEGLVLPGVGAFPVGIRNLRERGLATPLLEHRVPLLGICLGMQLLFERSQEQGSTDGLGLIRGQVRELRTGGLRQPHIGWNEVSFERPSPLTDGLPERGCPFYHVHSLVPVPRDQADVVATAEYGERFATMVQRDSVFGVQFHPEKSSAHGLRMLENFVRVCAVRPAPALRA
jgi:glutamine amidotransferase